MKTEPTKKYNREYMIIVTIQFPLYYSKKEEEDGTIIPQEIIEKEVKKCINNKEYDIQEEPADESYEE